MQKRGELSSDCDGQHRKRKDTGHSVTVLNVPVISHNAALTGALVSFVTGGSIEVTIEGNAVVKFLMVTKTFPFARTVPITVAQVAGIVTGQKKTDKPRIYRFFVPLLFPVFPFFSVPNSSFTIFTAHRSPHIEQVSVSPSRQWIARA